MLKLDLAKLEREGSLQVQAVVPESDPLWDGTGLRFVSALEVDLIATSLASGEYLVRGALRGTVGQECRRCLCPVDVPVDVGVSFLFGAPDVLGEPGEGDIRPVDPGAGEIDLGEPIREELMLTVAPYAVCSPSCKGLCSRCGVDLNVDTCECTTEERDPRWDALRALRTD